MSTRSAQQSQVVRPPPRLSPGRDTHPTIVRLSTRADAGIVDAPMACLPAAHRHYGNLGGCTRHHPEHLGSMGPDWRRFPADWRAVGLDLQANSEALAILCW
ncbi:hypothetical protein CTRI78_v004818 [Colletotrichum trifolii]|uniref:Uncharacterized protein n=1 Tax=Colletotrichum trifolii TaxID=5466 RepID=A0A4R8RG66_COLTR|nr:hypothetical protein CTRI78_v004818 [Colletotrichum trifolii]